MKRRIRFYCHINENKIIKQLFDFFMNRKQKQTKNILENIKQLKVQEKVP